ncbi:MAG: hypothetical protein C4547_04385 [Phycisphaerales bacterium]|nr:MAG: hypothetical protein C4547_04385 [Phycisphaerales bacterium]
MLVRKCCAVAACLALAGVVSADQPRYADDLLHDEAMPTLSSPAPTPGGPSVAADCVCSVFAQAEGGVSCVQAGCTHVAAACEEDPNGNKRYCNGGTGENDVLVNNGADDIFVQGGLGINGEDISAFEPPNCTFGNNTLVTAFHQADDFVVPEGQTWDIAQGITWIYQTGATREQLITEIYIQIYDGVPGGGGNIIGGDMITNRLMGTSEYSHANRVNPATPLDQARVIKTVSFDMSWLDPLEAGTYWIEFATRGQGASGPWLPVSAPGNPQTDNSRFFTVSSGAWAANVDGCSGAPSDRPFVLIGTGGGGDACQYALKKDSKAKKCDSCPAKGDLYDSGEACEEVGDCAKKIKVKKIDCPDGGDGFCKKIKGKRDSCG